MHQINFHHSMVEPGLSLCENRFESFPLVAGIYKKGLTTEERSEFVSAVNQEIRSNEHIIWQFFTGEHTWIAGGNFVGAKKSVTGEKGKGGCFLYFCTQQATLDICLNYAHEQLAGAWSVVIVDELRGVMLGRDFAGAQSMYYCQKNDALIFASSLTLFRYLGLEVSPKAIADFLHFLYIPAPRTIFENVYAILPSQLIRFIENEISHGKLPEVSTDSQCFANCFAKGQEEQCLLFYENKLINSVVQCCPEEQRVALFLSGGKDSSALAIAASRSGLKNIEAVSLGFSETEIDESEDARCVAECLGLPYRSLKFPQANYIRYWSEYIRNLGQPNGDCAGVPIFAALKETSYLYDVFLDGTGNDSYFGVPTSWQEDFAWYVHRALPILQYLPWHFFSHSKSYSISTIARFLNTAREEQFVSWAGWNAEEIKLLTGTKPEWQETALYQIYKELESPIAHKTGTLCFIWEPEAAYRKVAQLVNTAGKIVRYPFLDRDLISFSRSLPSQLKCYGRTNKVIIRMLLAKYLPSSIVNKTKGSFVFPQHYILKANNHALLDLLVAQDDHCRQNFLEKDVVSAYVERYRNGDSSVQDRIWALAILQTWLNMTAK